MAGASNLVVTVSPHIKSPNSTRGVMQGVLLALLPVTLLAMVTFGYSGSFIIVISMATSLFFEVIWHNLRMCKGVPRTWGATAVAVLAPAVMSAAGAGAIAPYVTLAVMVAFICSETCVKRAGEQPHAFDGSAAVTGLLLALVLPPVVPWWIPFIGAFVAISLGKEIFGGLGFNVFNPALAARAILVLSWPVYLTTGWYRPLGIDAATKATPLAIMKGGVTPSVARYYMPLLLQNTAGSIGEVSALLLVLGGLVLLWMRVITWHIPVTYLGTVAVLSLVMGGDPVFSLLAGGVMIGAFFMATDYVTSPVTAKGKILFGVMCGAITMVLRTYSKAPEGVTSAILFMNMCTPLIDRMMIPKPLGSRKTAGSQGVAK
ncbi:MAG: RnfABCDGE type electron transport complex subunit D [Firmicutes bacterium]|nr:RnfABCDGE type electron transport complex subunit D [Bacillota bacterium]